MATGQMYECEQQKEYLVAGKIERRWAKVPAALTDGVARELLRCMHCHGAVRLHKQRVPHGPADHVEHRSRADSTSCRGGHYFNAGTPHRMSSNPNT
jgi:hypothetical protein